MDKPEVRLHARCRRATGSSSKRWPLGSRLIYQSVNPFDGKLLQTFAELSDTQLEAKIATATACFDSWRHKSSAERAVIVNKAAAIMHDRTDELAHIVTPEMGKRINEARREV